MLLNLTTHQRREVIIKVPIILFLLPFLFSAPRQVRRLVSGLFFNRRERERERERERSKKCVVILKIPLEREPKREKQSWKSRKDETKV
jgi:hypothetical protein